MRKLAWMLIIVAGLAVIGIVLFRATGPPSYSLHLKTYFHRGIGLKAGALVRVDGVDVGSVIGVRVRPELGERPVEVLMSIKTPYQLNIPEDSTVSLSTAGVLGETLVDIDTRKSHGSPAVDNGVLKSVELTDAQTSTAIGEALIQASRSKASENQPAISGKATSPEK
jgi:phospholipid/cholesterol/gamma-HCH transport system substrate-binding protein